MIKSSISISNKLGLHARASAKLTKLAGSFKRGPPQPQHPARQRQEHHGRDDAGRRLGQRDRDRDRRCRRAGGDGCPAGAHRRTSSAKANSGGLPVETQGLRYIGLMSIQVFGMPFRAAWPSGAPCWWRPAASTWRTTSWLPIRRLHEDRRLRRRATPWLPSCRVAEARLPADAPHELAALLDVHLMLLHDDTLVGPRSLDR
jgi:hypothetical protein